MTQADEEAITTIKHTRTAKGLSQSELGQRVGLPQSHISKIEKGDVDIKLSSLIQIARALDLEVKLVPKKALPAVDSIIRSLPRDNMGAALSEIRKTRILLDRLDVPNVSRHTIDGLKALSTELEALQRLHYGAHAFPRLQRALEQVRKIMVGLDPIHTASDAAVAQKAATSQARQLARSVDDLKKLRSELAKSIAQEDPADLPAYSLDDNDD